MWTAQIGKAAMEADNDQKEEEEVPRPGLASRVADIKKALALGQCDLRSGIGQQFTTFLQGNEAEKRSTKHAVLLALAKCRRPRRSSG